MTQESAWCAEHGRIEPILAVVNVSGVHRQRSALKVAVLLQCGRHQTIITTLARYESMDRRKER